MKKNRKPITEVLDLLDKTHAPVPSEQDDGHDLTHHNNRHHHMVMPSSFQNLVSGSLSSEMLSLIDSHLAPSLHKSLTAQDFSVLHLQTCSFFFFKMDPSTTYTLAKKNQHQIIIWMNHRYQINYKSQKILKRSFRYQNN